MLLGKKLKRILALLTLTSLLAGSAMAQDNTGRFSRVFEGNKVSFDAWCFDDTAAAKLQASIEYAKNRCQLTVLRLIEEEKARYALELGNLQLRVDTLKREIKNTLAIKDEEIRQLEEAALKRPNDYTIWWASGGFLTGAATTIAIFLMVN
jgi:hypothetical protein